MSQDEDMSPLSSQLSSHDSSEFGDDIKEERDQSPTQDDNHLMPSTKRRRIGNYSHQSTPVPHAEIEDLGDISSDTEGSIPASPGGDRDKILGFPEDEGSGAIPHEQVTVCKWKDCKVGDLGNMDNLVTHVHDDHIGKNKKRYACEWEGCKNKENAAHASGYALKAHMRSHTKEKPFYCRLPECDRSFTRSDALAKHMRTVHETEALRPSDPVSKHHSSAAPAKPQRLKLILNSRPRSSDPDLSSNPSHPPSPSPSPLPSDDDATIYDDAASFHAFSYPPDVQFTDSEIAMAPNELFRLLRRQLHWAQEETGELQEEVRGLEAKRKDEWRRKELVLANLMEAETANAFKQGMGSGRHVEDLPDPMLPYKCREEGEGEVWYRRHSEFREM